MTMQSSVLLCTLVMLTTIACGTALADDAFVDHASPKTTIYSPISTNTKAIGQTTPLKEYKLLEETPRGYIVVLEKVPMSPPLGFIQKVNRLGNPTAKFRGGAIEILPMVNEPIFPGYIPFVKGQRYPIIQKQGTNLVLMYKSDLLTATGRVAQSDCEILTASFLQSEYDSKARPYVDAALSAAEYGKDYSSGVSALRMVAEQFPKSTLLTPVRNRLSEIDNEPYRRILAAIASASQTTNDAEVVRLLDSAIASFPNTVISPMAKRLREEAASSIAAAQRYAASQMAKGLVLFEGSWLRPEDIDSIKKSRLQEAQLAAALQQAKDDKYYESSINTLEAAIRDNPLANPQTKQDSKRYLLSLRDAFTAQQFEAEQKAKGLVKHDGEWMSAADVRSREGRMGRLGSTLDGFVRKYGQPVQWYTTDDGKAYEFATGLPGVEKLTAAFDSSGKAYSVIYNLGLYGVNGQTYNATLSSALSIANELDRIYSEESPWIRSSSEPEIINGRTVIGYKDRADGAQRVLVIETDSKLLAGGEVYADIFYKVFSSDYMTRERAAVENQRISTENRLRNGL